MLPALLTVIVLLGIVLWFVVAWFIVAGDTEDGILDEPATLDVQNHQGDG